MTKQSNRQSTSIGNAWQLLAWRGSTTYLFRVIHATFSTRQHKLTRATHVAFWRTSFCMSLSRKIVPAWMFGDLYFDTASPRKSRHTVGFYRVAQACSGTVYLLSSICFCLCACLTLCFFGSLSIYISIYICCCVQFRGAFFFANRFKNARFFSCTWNEWKWQNPCFPPVKGEQLWGQQSRNVHQGLSSNAFKNGALMLRNISTPLLNGHARAILERFRSPSFTHPFIPQ